MQVQKLRSTAPQGLVPAGAYFERLARDLRNVNAQEEARREKLDAEDRSLEARYRRASASRDSTFAA